MHRIPSRAVILAAVLVAAGCAGPAPTTPPGGSVATPPSASGSEPTPPPVAPSAPAPAATPSAIAPPALEGKLTCGAEDKQFPAAALDGPGGAEAEASPAAEALRRYLGSQPADGERMPVSGWHAVIEEPARVVFVARADGRWWLAELVRGADGTWQDWDRGQCRLAVVLPDGIGFAAWRLDPAALPLAADTTLRLLATETACASGRAIGGRMLEPIVLEAADAVTIALRVRTRPGGQDCQGNPEQAISVELASPVGARPVFDGSTVPPEHRGGAG